MSLKDTLTEQLNALLEERAAIFAESSPLREQRDAISNKAAEEVAQLNCEIRLIESKLPEIDSSVSMLTRALGGRRMSVVE